jgi:ABC-type polysaccharide/polyol phosphate transport system ATPase subunit
MSMPTIPSDLLAGPPPPGAPAAQSPVVIEAQAVSKTFRIPDRRVDSLKERFTHPLRRVEHRTIRALHDVSFDIHKGEFFGIVGRNGSGKSTLLKILASIYRADSGRVRVAGRMAPFIELGVGFNPELAARQNVVLNGVLMGLSRRQAESRFEAVLEFAELEDFAELKLKNYSSGMMVRLAFSIMVQADADVMLIDEVLAVGDAAFAQKCMDVFHERRRAGKTIVLVTHDMSTVQSLCDRALLLHHGEPRLLAGAEEVALAYFRLNFDTPEASTARRPGELPRVMDLNVRILEATLRDRDGQAIQNLEQGSPLLIDILIEAAQELTRPGFTFHIVNEAGVVVAAFTRTLDVVLRTSARVRLRTEIDNPLVPGRYYLDCWTTNDGQSDVKVQPIRMLQFFVYGTAPRFGVVTLDARIEATIEEPGTG